MLIGINCCENIPTPFERRHTHERPDCDAQICNITTFIQSTILVSYGKGHLGDILVPPLRNNKKAASSK